MSDKPILFSAPMVRALLSGTKTQTRRLIPSATQDAYDDYDDWCRNVSAGVLTSRQWEEEYFLERSLIQPRDILWVREAHALVPSSAYRMSEGVEQTVNPSDKHEAAVYRCDWERSAPPWRPSIHMPRWASRLTLTVTDVRVQRLNEISEEDASAEGVEPGFGGGPIIEDYLCLWNSIHGPFAADTNPWVAAYTFTVERRNIDAAAPMPGSLPVLNCGRAGR